MKKLIFTLTLLLASNVFAATGTGHAQTQLSNPLSITNTRDIDFGTIAIDPSAGSQTVEMIFDGFNIICPSAYVCPVSGMGGLLRITKAPNTEIHLSVESSTATLSDGNGNTIIFDPIISGFGETATFTNSSEEINFGILGSLFFTGNEPAGTYSTRNTGGSGYQVTVNY